MIMKKTITLCLAVFIVAAIGCQKREEASKATPPPTPTQAAAPQPAPPQPTTEPKAAAPAASPQMAVAPPASDPHAGLKLKEMPSGAGHKGKILQIMDAGGYTYLEVEEKGKKIWVAGMKLAANKGDVVEFPDSPPMENFHSKTLKKTFDKIIFAESIKIVK
jgi:pyruvate/2-oxoglutarate dehydrogenase complex dihydrolipoamide acyltransferase (E2) component